MTADELQSRMLAEMSECAYRLGKAFAAEAERAEAPQRRLEYFQLFDRCFFAVRVATALRLRLRRATGAWSVMPSARDAGDRDEREGERTEHEGPEKDRGEVGDRERDREVEAANLPTLLRTLERVADDASALPGPQPAELPALRELLAGARSRSGAPRAGDGALRARLAASTTNQPLALAALASRPPGPSLLAGFASRRTTGPPPRRGAG